MRCSRSLPMSLEMWAVAAVAIVDREGTPLLLRTYTSSKEVLNSSAAPLHAHLYVGPEDVIRLHFVLFASLDRCEELRIVPAPGPASGAERSTSASTMTVAGRNPAGPLFSSREERSSKLAGEAMAATDSSRSQSRLGPESSSMLSRGGDSMRILPSTSMAPRGVTGGTSDVRFLGKLIESHRMRSYGFYSATGIRTLLVTVGCDAPADAMVPLCRALYESASAALCNPFNTPAQCWRAQEELLRRSFEDQHRASSTAAAEGGRTSLSPPQSTCLVEPPSGAMEWSWPRPAPTSASALAAVPTLALSKNFTGHLESLLATFTVTARSCIIR